MARSRRRRRVRSLTLFTSATPAWSNFDSPSAATALFVSVILLFLLLFVGEAGRARCSSGARTRRIVPGPTASNHTPKVPGPRLSAQRPEETAHHPPPKQPPSDKTILRGYGGATP